MDSRAAAAVSSCGRPVILNLGEPESMAAVLLFAVTLSVDRAAFHHEVTLPSWVISGSPDAARQILSLLAATIITVVPRWCGSPPSTTR
jgi:hypothetical protein